MIYSMKISRIPQQKGLSLPLLPINHEVLCRAGSLSSEAVMEDICTTAASCSYWEQWLQRDFYIWVIHDHSKVMGWFILCQEGDNCDGVKRALNLRSEELVKFKSSP